MREKANTKNGTSIIVRNIPLMNSSGGTNDNWSSTVSSIAAACNITTTTIQMGGIDAALLSMWVDPIECSKLFRLKP